MQLLRDLARGAFTYAPPTLGPLTRAMEVDRRFADLSLGLVGASVEALAESLGIAELEADVGGRADLTLAARHRAVVLRDAPEHAIALPAALRVMIDEAGAL
jgi:hypothetical protein